MTGPKDMARTKYKIMTNTTWMTGPIDIACAKYNINDKYKYNVDDRSKSPAQSRRRLT